MLGGSEVQDVEGRQWDARAFEEVPVLMCLEQDLWSIMKKEQNTRLLMPGMNMKVMP